MISVAITSGGTTISLSSNGCMLAKYTPIGPAFSKERGWQEVTEAIEFVIADISVDAVQAKLSQIEQLLRKAESTPGARVFLLFRAHETELPYRSEIYSYRILVDADVASSLPQKLLGVQLILTRSWWWEGQKVGIPLSNRNGSNLLTPLTVKNHTDSGAGNDNFAIIAEGIIKGSVPAPLQLKLINNSSSSRFFWRFFIANSLTPSAEHILQAENIVPGYGTVISSSGASNGEVVTRTSSIAGDRLRFRWELSEQLVNELRGEYVRVLGKMGQIWTAGTRTNLALLDKFGLLEFSSVESALLTADTKVIQDFGILQIPPLTRETNWAGYQLELSIFAQAANEIYSIDFLQFTPTRNGQYRILTQLGYATPTGEGIVDDGIEELTYYEDLDNVRWTIVKASGESLKVWPEAEQKLLFLYDGEIDWSLGVQAWYRPRRTIL